MFSFNGLYSPQPFGCWAAHAPSDYELSGWAACSPDYYALRRFAQEATVCLSQSAQGNEIAKSAMKWLSSHYFLYAPPAPVIATIRDKVLIVKCYFNMAA